MNNRVSFLFVSMLALLTGQALASQVIPSAGIETEIDSEFNKICQFSHESARAAAETALRSNRIKIIRDEDPNGMKIYIGGGSFFELAGKRFCAVSLQVEFFNYSRVTLPVSNQNIHSRVVHCKNGIGGIVDKNSIQDDLNSSVKRMIDECISRIESKAK